jgi:hypothetical protein
MSVSLTSRSADLRRLFEEGYEVEARDGHLVVYNVPYVGSIGRVRRGTLVTPLTLDGDVTSRPETHVASFGGEAPCDEHGAVISSLLHSSESKEIVPGVIVDHMFSSKPPEGYVDYYELITSYVAILATPAQTIEPGASAMTFRVVETDREESVFLYEDTASARAEISSITAKLAAEKVAIVGLGGTGSYIFDLMAKTPVRELHIWDGDVQRQHNAFRSPGAMTIEELRARESKVDYIHRRYSGMRRGIVPHAEPIDASNVHLLRDMDFVFVAVDKSDARKLIVDQLEECGVAFIDVGMGIDQVDGALTGLVRTTTSTPGRREGRRHLPLAEAELENLYAQNIQIADLNALNAVLAVIKWKKLRGFYLDLDHEHHAVYQTDGNVLSNDEMA